MTARFSKWSVTAALLAMLVPKPKLQMGQRKNLLWKYKFLPKSFPEWFGPQTTEPISFWKSCLKNQFKLIIPKKCWFWSRKGLNIWTLFYALLMRRRYPATIEPATSFYQGNLPPTNKKIFFLLHLRQTTKN